MGVPAPLAPPCTGYYACGGVEGAGGLHLPYTAPAPPAPQQASYPALSAPHTSALVFTHYHHDSRPLAIDVTIHTKRIISSTLFDLLHVKCF